MNVSAEQTASVFDVDAASFQHDVLDASHSVPVLVDFWAQWCAPCKALGPVLEKLVQDSNGAVRLAKIDIDANQQFAGANGIRSIPTVRLFVDGAAVGEFMGAQPEQAIRAFLAQHLPAAGGEAPDESASAANVIEALLHEGQAEQAAIAIAQLDDDERETPLMQRLAARVDLACKASDVEQVDELRRRLLANENDLQTRFALGLRQAAEANWDDAIDNLLKLLAISRNFDEGAARQVLLKVFEAMGSDDPRVNEGRAKLAGLLH